MPHSAPMMGRNAVATSQPLAAQAGMRMLMLGGNAVDAAIATAMALTVVEPTGCGIGSDAFAIVWDGNTLHGLNASGRSPASWHADMFAGKNAVPELGWDAVTVHRRGIRLGGAGGAFRFAAVNHAGAACD